MLADYPSLSRALCGAALLLFSSQALSADASDEPLPSLEFLEYLGEWQDGNGQMVDPIVLGKSVTLDGEFEQAGEEQ